MQKFYLHLYILFLISIISAQWITDPALNNPVCVFEQRQDEVALCSDQAGGLFIFWRDYRDETGIFGGDIYGQHMDAAGVTIWDENGVSIYTTIYGEFRPHAIPDGEGGVILLISQTPGSFYNYRLYCQRYDSTGNNLWGDNGATIASGNGTNSFPQITPDNNGGAFIVWQNLPGTPGTNDIYVQHVDSAGIQYWPEDGLAICDTFYNQGYPVLCPDGKGGVFIAWQDQRDSTDIDIYGQYIDSSKILIWQENGIVLCQTEGNVEFPVITGDGQGGAFVAWIDYRNSEPDIGLQQVSSTGELRFGEAATLVCSAGNQQSNATIVSDGNGAYIVWQDGRTGDYNIYAQYIDQEASAQWTENGIVINNEDQYQLIPAALVDDQGNCFITWRDNRDHDWGDIYGQVVNSAGELLWPDEGVALATAGGLEQEEPVVELISPGNYVTSWRDRRNETDYDVYVQKSNRDENLKPPVHIENRNEEIICNYELIQNYPNPFNSSTVIGYTLSRKSNIELSIFNIIGEKITTLVMGQQDPGSHKVSWNAANLSSGVYFCCLKVGNKMKIKRMLYLK
jgi:hypothetical protein